MAAKRKSEICWNPDPVYLNELISEKISRASPVTHKYTNWHLHDNWIALLEEADGAICVEWDGHRARAYFTNSACKLRPVRGSDIGTVVCTAWARLNGLLHTKGKQHD